VLCSIAVAAAVAASLMLCAGCPERIRTGQILADTLAVEG
jgi:hypothetical protein